MMNAPKKFQSPSAADYAAIADVIRAETLAFQSEDFEAWKECWVQDGRTHDIGVSPTAGLSVVEGWSSISAQMQHVFRERMSCKVIDFDQTNLRVNVAEDTAWVVFDSWARNGHGVLEEKFETRFLERDEQKWKIVYASFVQKHVDSSGAVLVGLDQCGHLVRSSTEALKALEDHPVLTVSAGRVRAHRSEWDRELQVALSQAGRHHGFFETHKFAEDAGSPARYPVVLGQHDDGGVIFVQFSIRDCMTYLRLTTDDLLERRLGFAKTIFGLSTGQLRVAYQIALGKGLKTAAGDLGISVNTARTHLSRLYEKTGVRTQTALVRLLLSVG